MLQRLKHIDCLRGVSMLMVVYSHVLSFCFGHLQPSPFGQFMQDEMLPLFFFISGYCAYKVGRKWTASSFGRNLLQKTRAILIPTIVMFMLFMLYSSQNPMEVAFQYDKSGYWFTWVLFQILLLYYVSDIIASRFENRIVKALVVSAPLVLFVPFTRIVGYNSQVATFFEWIKVNGFYFFFFSGVLVRMFATEFERLMSNRYANALLLIVAIASYNLMPGGVKRRYSVC